MIRRKQQQYFIYFFYFTIYNGQHLKVRIKKKNTMSHHILCNFTFWQKCHLKKAFALLCCIFCCHACSIPGINKVSVAISSVSSHTVKLALRFTIAIELYSSTTYISTYYNIYFVLHTTTSRTLKLRKPQNEKTMIHNFLAKFQLFLLDRSRFDQIWW